MGHPRIFSPSKATCRLLTLPPEKPSSLFWPYLVLTCRSCKRNSVLSIFTIVSVNIYEVCRIPVWSLTWTIRRHAIQKRLWSKGH